MCSRCHKRAAVVFMTKLENGKRVNEGVCMKCARELGLPLDNLLGDYMNKMGISPDQLVEMEDGVTEMLSEMESDPEGGAPAIDFNKLFGDGKHEAEADASDTDEKSEKNAPKEKKNKKAGAITNVNLW